MTKAAGKKLIAERVDEFEKNKAALTKRGHGETNIRTNYIDVLFESLGWNMKSHYEVVREFSQKDTSGTKKVDYAFKVNGKLKFFVEAKEASVDLVNDKDAIYQAKRYAYSTNGRAPIVILTDFEEFRVFNVLKAPDYNNTDRELLKNYCFEYNRYLENWDLLWDTFSKEAVEKGSLDAIRGKIDKNTKTMDVDFLEQITEWRETLAKNIALRNKELSVEELNEAVQRILDRLLFIRNLEDREIEPENTLLEKTKAQADVYKSIIPVFRNLDNVYNGLLFKKHFSEDLNIDDKALKDIIKNMCYPVSPFQFDVIEPEILGRIYEKFLGSKIRLTESHQAKVEEKMEVRKAGGVYYTPEYIVDYIVKNTVGKKIEGLTPEEIKKIKIVDPACGSGSFLLGAYSYILDYHFKWYSQNKKDKAYKADYYINKDGELKVSLEKRGDILRNNIFGVDIDKEATEVAIMSLYLKMLDDGFDKGERDLFFIKGHVLPDMTGNVKCGNSLIDREALLANNMFGDEDISPFDWSSKGILNNVTNEMEGRGFPEVFENGGFDCVIGNPPYIKTQEMQKYQSNTAELYKKLYLSAAEGNADIYVVFIEKALELLNHNGIMGYICPHKFFNSGYGKNIRKILSDKKHICKILHFGVNQIFENATTYTCLLFLSKIQNISFKYYEYKDEVRQIQNEIDDIQYFDVDAETVNENDWIISNRSTNKLMRKIEKGNFRLSEITTNIFQGPKAGADPVFILNFIDIRNGKYLLHSNSLNKDVELEIDLLRPYTKGKYIRRNEIKTTNEWIIYPYDNNGKLIDIEDIRKSYPLIYLYLSDKENKNILLSREEGRFKKTWWCYSRPQNMMILFKEKILTPFNAFNASFAYDIKRNFVFSAGVSGAYGIILKDDSSISYHYLVALLNSTMIDKYIKEISTALRGSYYSYENKYIKQVPIVIPQDELKLNIAKEIENLQKRIIEMIGSAKSQADVAFLEKKIDELVYKLYGLTEEEIRIVES